MKRDLRRSSESLELLKTLDPIGGSAIDDEAIESALDELGAAIASRPPRAPRRLPRAARHRSIVARHRALVIAAAILAIGAGVAAAGTVIFSAHTGLFPTKAEQEMGGPGEALNPAAPDFRAVT